MARPTRRRVRSISIATARSSRRRRRARTATTRARGSTPARPRSATARTPTATRAQYSAVPCTTAPACGNSTAGTAICDQATQTVGACSTDVTCACAPDSTAMSECRNCVLDFEHGSGAADVKVCEPAIDTMIDTQGACSQLPCTVEVVATTGGWEATVASTSQGPFTELATGVTSAFGMRVASDRRDDHGGRIGRHGVAGPDDEPGADAVRASISSSRRRSARAPVRRRTR